MIIIPLFPFPRPLLVTQSETILPPHPHPSTSPPRQLFLPLCLGHYSLGWLDFPKAALVDHNDCYLGRIPRPNSIGLANNLINSYRPVAILCLSSFSPRKSTLCPSLRHFPALYVKFCSPLHNLHGSQC